MEALAGSLAAGGISVTDIFGAYVTVCGTALAILWQGSSRLIKCVVVCLYSALVLVLAASLLIQLGVYPAGGTSGAQLKASVILLLFCIGTGLVVWLARTRSPVAQEPRGPAQQAAAADAADRTSFLRP